VRSAELNIDDAIVLALPNEQLSRHRGKARDVEGELVKTGIDRQRLAVKRSGQQVAIAENLDVRQVLPVLARREDDGWKRALGLVHPPPTILADELGAARIDATL
jgi:hypothetical protein